jgi:putative transposase
MTAPRQVLPGRSYLITRRCSQRQYLLRPSPETSRVFGFLLAVAARRYGVEIHAYCVMSNHVHLVLSDPEARLPAFSQFLASLVARAMNRALGRSESFWGPSSYSAVALERPLDVLDKIAYVLANPVAAGLVQHGREWPGLWSGPEKIGRASMEFDRPDRFFRARGAKSLPAKAFLALTPPDGFDSAEAFRRALLLALAQREKAAALALARDGRGFAGAQGVTTRSALGSPEPARIRRGLNPQVACRDLARRIEALGRLVKFRRDYRRAFQAWRDGLLDVLFPAGTYLMRVSHGVACVPAG